MKKAVKAARVTAAWKKVHRAFVTSRPVGTGYRANASEYPKIPIFGPFNLHLVINWTSKSQQTHEIITLKPF